MRQECRFALHPQLYLEGLWREGRKRTKGARKLVRKYGTFGLLVVDEWLPISPMWSSDRYCWS